MSGRTKLWGNYWPIAIHWLNCAISIVLHFLGFNNSTAFSIFFMYLIAWAIFTAMYVGVSHSRS